MKTLWVVGAGHESTYGIRRAHDMGLRVVVSDRDPGALQQSGADVLVQADTYDIPTTVALALAHNTKHPIHGVLSFASDVPLTVANVAAALLVPGIPLPVAEVAADKWRMKQALVAAGVQTPWGCLAADPATLTAIVRHGPGKHFIVKPPDSRGARGVIRMLPDVDPVWAWETAKSYSPTGRVLVEQWLDGPQVSTETVVWPDGTFVTPGFVDRCYDRLEQFRPYVIEDGATQPTVLPPLARRKLVSLAELAAHALGFVGIAKGDLVLTPFGPAVIEMAARLSGGLMSSVQVPAATGVDLVGAAIKLAIGEPVTPKELQPKKKLACAMRFFFPSPGRVVTTHEPSPLPTHVVAARVPQVRQVIEPTTDHTKRPGYVIATASAREGAIATASRFIDACEVRTAPL